MAGGCSREGSSSNNAGGCQFEPSDEQQLPPALNSRLPADPQQQKTTCRIQQQFPLLVTHLEQQVSQQLH